MMNPVPSAVAPKAIGDQTVWDSTAALEQLAEEPRGGMAIPTGLKQVVDDIPVLVNGAPEILALAANRHEEFVQMPCVADRPGPMPKPPRVRQAEGLAPVPDGFVRDGDAAVWEEVFDVAEAEGEPTVEPDGVADDGARESVAGIADVVGHPATLSAVPSS